jgi:hypothetical protein
METINKQNILDIFEFTKDVFNYSGKFKGLSFDKELIFEYAGYEEYSITINEQYFILKYNSEYNDLKITQYSRCSFVNYLIDIKQYLNHLHNETRKEKERSEIRRNEYFETHVYPRRYEWPK